MSDVSTIVTTLDERLHVTRVIGSARALGPVFVVDAGSSDGTQDLARAAGAKVVQNAWQGYSAQKNWALGNLPIKTPWVLFLDADEYLTPVLRAEIAEATQRGEFDGYWLPEMNVFFGRPLKHAWWYPAYQLRLFRYGKGRYEDRAVHESVLLDGRAGFLKETLYHESLKGIDAHMERHLRYATYEAGVIRRVKHQGFGSERTGKLFGSWPERRRFLKVKVWYRMPARPAVRFFWMYFVKRGFLDGREGRVYCELMAAQEALINAKLLEQDRDADAREADENHR